MRPNAPQGARLGSRSPLARELWLVVAVVVIFAVAVVTVLVPAIKNEHPNDDDGPTPAAGQHAAPQR